jgi:hypothetical protein
MNEAPEVEPVPGRMFEVFDIRGDSNQKRGINCCEVTGKVERAFAQVLGLFGYIHVSEGDRTLRVNRKSAKKFIEANRAMFDIGPTKRNFSDEEIGAYIKQLYLTQSMLPSIRTVKQNFVQWKKPQQSPDPYELLGLYEPRGPLISRQQQHIRTVPLTRTINAYKTFEKRIKDQYSLLPIQTRKNISLEKLLNGDANELQNLAEALLSELDPKTERGEKILYVLCNGDGALIEERKKAFNQMDPASQNAAILRMAREFYERIEKDWDKFWESRENEFFRNTDKRTLLDQVLRGESPGTLERFTAFLISRGKVAEKVEGEEPGEQTKRIEEFLGLPSTPDQAEVTGRTVRYKKIVEENFEEFFSQESKNKESPLSEPGEDVKPTVLDSLMKCNNPELMRVFKAFCLEKSKRLSTGL